MFIIPTIEEENVSKSYNGYIRQNSPKINYFNKVNDKPWGKEYLAFQNKHIGIWILHVNKDQETSLHCHFKKDTILCPLSGSFKINLFNDKFKLLNLFDFLYAPKNTFHGIHSYVNDGVIMEIEVYTDCIQYTDKNDLLRLKDMYNRDKNNYETSVVERPPHENEIMYFNDTNKYIINNTELEVLEIKSIDNKLLNYDKIVLLEGSVFIDNKRVTSGSFIDLNTKISVLSDTIKCLCLKNVDYNCMKKILYSKSHLHDFLLLNNSERIGLTCGCFDILHEGHITNLKLCKKNCDTLFVCLSSDDQIKRLKGETRPINKLNDRKKMLMQFDFIDYIILYDEINDELESELDNIMNIVNPTIWFKGGDYTVENIKKKHPCLKKILLFDLVQGKSSTNIINKIRE